MGCCRISKRGLLILLGLLLTSLFLILIETPLSPSEARLLESDHFTPAIWIAREMYALFHTVWAMRIPFFFLSILNLWIYRDIVLNTIKEEKARNLAVLIYMLLPGVILSSVLVNSATFAIFFSLLFIWALQKDIFLLQIVSLSLLYFTDTAAFTMYMAVLWYTYDKKKWKLFSVASVLLILSFALARYPIGGIPHGHLTELLGVYSALFSPLVFLYFIYALYRAFLEKQRSFLWYLSLSAFLISLLLSIRQKILITDFSPYLLIGIPVLINVYLSSLLIRMKRFQRPYCWICRIVLISLIISSAIVILNKPLYYMLGKPNRFFASEVYRIPERIKLLRKERKDCASKVHERNKALYRFYHFPLCNR